MKKPRNRPQVVLYMIQSLDGRIDCAMVDSISGDEYYTALDSLACDSVLNGRVTMEHYCAEVTRFAPKDPAPVGKPKTYKAVEAKGYAVSVDTNGVLRWPDKSIDGKPLVCVVSEKASAEYLAYLERKGISYIAAGRQAVNLGKVLSVLSEVFGVRRLALLGGGHINGGFLEKGLIDEYAFLIAPGIDGRAGMTASVDGLASQKRKPVRLALTGVRKMGESVLLKYEQRRTVK